MDYPTPYHGLVVVEVADDPAGEMTGLQFVNLGAEVIKVEPPEGAPSRHCGPFVDDERDPDRSLAFWYYNGGKRSVVVDLDARRPRRTAGADRRADVLVVALHPRRLRQIGIDLPALADARPGLLDRVDHRLRAHRPVGRVPVLRPRGTGHERAADHVRIRRPLDPADPSRRQPGVPHGGQLRPSVGAARSPAATADRCGRADRRLDPGGRRPHRRVGQPVLVLSPRPRPASDLPSRAAGADSVGDLPVRRRQMGVLRPDPRRSEAVERTGALDGQPRPCRRPHRSGVRRPRVPTTELRPHPGPRRGVLPAPGQRRCLPRRPAARLADRRAQRPRRPVR